MNIENCMKPSLVKPVASFRAIKPPRTKNQMRAIATADGLAVEARWTILVAETNVIWEKEPPEGLARENAISTSPPGSCGFSVKSAMKYYAGE